MISSIVILTATTVFWLPEYCPAQQHSVDISAIPYALYPLVNIEKPDLPSPFTTTDNREYVIALTKNDAYAIIDVTLGDTREICKQRVVDAEDFPYYAENGVHSDRELSGITEITGRSLSDINELARPNGLSQAGFMADDEDILSVIKADNDIVKKLNLTHPQLARPLFQVLNMMDTDLALGRWNMARHHWENIYAFRYNDRKIFVEAEDTKGGQLSIFNDGIEGGFYIRIWRELDERELAFLGSRYNHLTTAERDKFVSLLSSFNTGEIEPQYIMRYGFYEGHTYWRTDPITLSFVFGIKSLEELESLFPGKLYDILTMHFTK